MTTDRNSSDDRSLLLFDFDGVLLNSVVEMSITAYNSVSGNLATTVGDLPGNVAELFRNNRYHVQPAGDAINLMAWCIENTNLSPNFRLSSEAYCTIRDGSKIPLVDRTEQFFAARERLVDSDPVQWISLNTVYEPIWNVLKELGAGGIVILTNKNKAATLTLCNYFGLPVLEANVYSGDHGTTKIENLLQIQARFDRDRYAFIDDSIGNLYEIDAYFNQHKTIIELMLASWGYTGPDDHLLAQSSGYSILEQSDLIARITSMKDLALGEA